MPKGLLIAEVSVTSPSPAQSRASCGGSPGYEKNWSRRQEDTGLKIVNKKTMNWPIFNTAHPLPCSEISFLKSFMYNAIIFAQESDTIWFVGGYFKHQARHWMRKEVAYREITPQCISTISSPCGWATLKEISQKTIIWVQLHLCSHTTWGAFWSMNIP